MQKKIKTLFLKHKQKRFRSKNASDVLRTAQGGAPVLSSLGIFFVWYNVYMSERNVSLNKH